MVRPLYFPESLIDIFPSNPIWHGDGNRMNRKRYPSNISREQFEPIRELPRGHFSRGGRGAEN
jgi:hypothetical protein